MPENPPAETAGMRSMFWVWTAVIFGGLIAFGFGGEWHWEIIVTASVIATVPMIILFFVAQRQIIQGASTSGLKG